MGPGPPCPSGCGSAPGAASSASRVLCCRRLCKEPTAWKPCSSNSESSCWPTTERPAVQGWGGRGGSRHPCAWGWGQAPPALPLPSFFRAWSRHGCGGPCQGTRQPSGVRWLCFSNKSALVSTAVPVLSVSPGGAGDSVPLASMTSFYSLVDLSLPARIRAGAQAALPRGASGRQTLPTPCSCVLRPSPWWDLWARAELGVRSLLRSSWRF